MTLPKTILCTGCNTPIPVDKVQYSGIHQPDPTQDGFHAYMVTAVCTSCNFRVVTLHKENEKQ